MLTLEICLPLIVIVGCLLIGLIVDLKNGDKLFRQDYKGRHTAERSKEYADEGFEGKDE